MFTLGEEAVAVEKFKRKADKSDTLMETIKFLSDHFYPAINEYAEIAVFDRVSLLESKSVNYFIMLLRFLSFGDDFEKELQRKFVLYCDINVAENKLMHSTKNMSF